MKKKPAGEKPTEEQAPKATKSNNKFEVCVSRARSAFVDSDYSHALKWALKALDLEPRHQGIRDLALECAGALRDVPTILFILGEMYQDCTLQVREDFLVVGRMAMLHQNFQLAEEVFQALLDDAASEEPRLEGRLTKAMLKVTTRSAGPCRGAAAGPEGQNGEGHQFQGSRPGSACEKETRGFRLGRPAPEQKKGTRAGRNAQTSAQI